MRVLFIGGTGIISSACTRLAAQRGLDLTLLTRGRHSAALPAGVRTIGADIDDPASAASALASRSFDAVVDWIAYTPAHIERDLALSAAAPRQFVFISSASAYQKPADGLSDHRIHASLQPLLAVLPRQDRLRRTPPPGLSRRRLPGHHRPPLPHLWRHLRFLWSSTVGPAPTLSSTACAAASRSSSPATAPRSGPSPTTAISPSASSACWATPRPSATPSTSPPTRSSPGTSSSASSPRPPAPSRAWSHPFRFHRRLPARQARHPARRQIQQLRLRQLQDQALRPHLPRDRSIF